MVWGDHRISCRDGGHYTTSGDKCVCHQGSSWGYTSGDHIQRDMALSYSRNNLRYYLDIFSPNCSVSAQFYVVVTQVSYIVSSDALGLKYDVFFRMIFYRYPRFMLPPRPIFHYTAAEINHGSIGLLAK